MKVLKRDGRIQEFDIGKIRLTLQRASDEANEPFTGADINVVSKAIEDEIFSNGRNEIMVKEILDIVISKLRELGFSDVARFYWEYEHNFYKE